MAEEDGNNYYLTKIVSMDAGDQPPVYFMFITPPRELHAKILLVSSGNCYAELYEGGNATPGERMYPLNNNRNMPDSSGMKCFENPTVVEEGNCIWRGIVSPSVTGVAVQFNYEIIIRKDTLYLWKLTKVDSGAIVVGADFFWSE